MVAQACQQFFCRQRNRYELQCLMFLLHSVIGYIFSQLFHKKVARGNAFCTDFRDIKSFSTLIFSLNFIALISV